MNKIIIVLCAILAAAKGHQGNEENMDDYIDWHRQKFNEVLQNYDETLLNVADHYNRRINNVEQKFDAITAKINEFEERSSLLSVLSEYNKECVRENIQYTVRVEYVRQKWQECIATAVYNISSLFDNVKKHRDELQQYLENELNAEIHKCGSLNNELSGVYKNCIFSVTSSATDFRIKNQKDFEYELDVAECDAKAVIRKVIDCTFSVQSETITLFGKGNQLVDICTMSRGQCLPCPRNTCSEKYDLHVNYENTTIVSPFHEGNAFRGCLMLNAI